jgi:uncharacterized protein YjiS (DUF1127 family)
MTTTAIEPSDSASPCKTKRAWFWRYAASILTNAKRGLAIRKGRRQLCALPDCMLKDLGISRCDSDYLAAHGEFAVRLVSGYNRCNEAANRRF